MSTTQPTQTTIDGFATASHNNGDDSSPFHTEVINGTEVVGVLFVARNGGFYEFVDPTDHDDYARFRNPRTGDTMVYESEGDRALKRVIGGHTMAHVPAERWAAFRADYIAADDDTDDEWREEWQGFMASVRNEVMV